MYYSSRGSSTPFHDTSLSWQALGARMILGRRCKRCSRVRECSSVSLHPPRAVLNRCAKAGCACGRSTRGPMAGADKAVRRARELVLKPQRKGGREQHLLRQGPAVCQATAGMRARGVDRNGAYPPSARCRCASCETQQGKGERVCGE
jgi:hypothetical protein